MHSRARILESLRQIKPEMERQFHVREMALFGSYSRNEQTEASDVDLLVDFTETIGGLAFVRFADTLEARLGLRVDVVPADAVKPHYRQHIQKDLVYV